MSVDVDKLLEVIISKQEGGYVLSKDPDNGDGGWTYAGVTKTTMDKLSGFSTEFKDYEAIDEWLKLAANRETISNIVNDIYRRNYVPKDFDSVPIFLAGPYLSASINLGDNPAAVIYSITRQSVALESQLSEFNYWWLARYVDIVINNPRKLQFLRGWKNRINFWHTFDTSTILAAK